jgi:hypothetical protein
MLLIFHCSMVVLQIESELTRVRVTTIGFPTHCDRRAQSMVLYLTVSNLLTQHWKNMVLLLTISLRHGL